MTPHTTPIPRSQADRSAETRRRILDAALREFAAQRPRRRPHRTDCRGRRRQQGAALLLLRKQGKALLRGAGDGFGAGARPLHGGFSARGQPRRALLRAALDHFDRILTQREFQSLMQQEMMRLHKGEEGELPILVKRSLRRCRQCSSRWCAKESRRAN